MAKRVTLVAAGYVLLLAALYWFPVPRSGLGWAAFLLLAPPLYLFGEWIGGRVAGSWWESSLLGKAIKAALLIVIVLALLVVGAFLRGV